MNSVKTKFAILICLILVLSIGGISFVTYYRTQDSLGLQLKDDLMNLTKVSAREISGRVQRNIADVDSLANDDTIRNLDKVNGMARIDRDIQRLPQYETMLITDLNGNVLFGNNNPSGNRADRDYFKQVIALNKSVVSDPLISRTTNNLVYVIATPVKKGAVALGVLIATVKIDTINQFIGTIKTGKTGYAFATSSEALIFAHPNKDNVMKLHLVKDTGLAQSLRDVGARILKKESGIMNYQFQGQDKYMGFMPVEGTPWSMGVALTTAEFMEDIIATRNFALMLALIFIFLAVLPVYLIVARMVKPIQSMTCLAESLASGDYTQNSLSVLGKESSLTTKNKLRQDEIERLFVAFRMMVNNTRSLLAKVHQNSQKMADSSQQLTASTEQSAQVSSLVATSITEVATSAIKQNRVVNDVNDVVQQTAASVEEVAATTTEVSAMADKMLDTSQKGKQAIENVVSTMQSIKNESAQSAEQALHLSTSAEQIKEIVTVIKNIAGQTNLLALNASIEAARAGEHGRGFAIVADEVRKLAEQSAEASEQITHLVDEIHSKVTAVKQEIDHEGIIVAEGIHVAGRAGESFEELSGLLDITVAQIKEVSNAIQHVAKGNQRVVSAVQVIDESSRRAAEESQTVAAATEEQAESMEKIATASRALTLMAEELNGEVSKFRL